MKNIVLSFVALYLLFVPGPSGHWLPKHNGISRGVFEEGQQHFQNVDDAMIWIEKCKQWVPLVYRNDGLLVAYGKALSREQPIGGVWRIMINGQKPVKLEGSGNDAIYASWDNPSFSKCVKWCRMASEVILDR